MVSMRAMVVMTLPWSTARSFCPFPPCGGRLGRGVMQRRVTANHRLRECAPVGAVPPFQLRLSSLRSLSLRILPPQGGQGKNGSSFHVPYPLQPAFELRAGEVAALVVVADRVGRALRLAVARLLQHGFGIAGRPVAVAVGDGVVPPAARVGRD